MLPRGSHLPERQLVEVSEKLKPPSLKHAVDDDDIDSEEEEEDDEDIWDPDESEDEKTDRLRREKRLQFLDDVIKSGSS